MPIIESIVSQHAEESAFLWSLRDSATGEPHYSLQDLSDLDNRVEAHLDGLRVAGDEGWPFLSEGLGQQESGEVFSAAVLALEGNDQSKIEQVYAVVDVAPETLRGLISGIGWVPPDRLQGKIAGLLASASPLWRRAGIAACAVHRVDCGRHLQAAIDDPDAKLRARALRAAGEVARLDLLPLVQREIASGVAECSYWAAWSAALLGNRTDALSALKAVAMAESPYRVAALDVLVRILKPAEAHAWLKELAGIPSGLRVLIGACGSTGDPVYVPWLIKQMSSLELARVAGESVATITGVDIAYQDLEAEKPEGFEAGPTDNPEDEDVSMDPDEDLPWPDPHRIAAWWGSNQHRFTAGRRYLAGKPVSEAQCRQVLGSGLQRQRKAAALELALSSAKEPLFEVRAPGFRQQRLLGVGSSIVPAR